MCNEYLQEFANKCGAKNVLLAPTVIDIKKYQKKSYSNINEEFRIGWVGSPSTTKYLYILKNILEKISKKYEITLVVIGGEELKNFNIPIEYHKWSYESENTILSSFDIGIMPLHKTKWEEGKCGFKLIQYMASGLPVIASCVGYNRKIVDKSFGFLAKNESDWESAIEYLINNKDQLKNYGENARQKAEKNYALQDWSKVMLKNIKGILNQK